MTQDQRSSRAITGTRCPRRLRELVEAGHGIALVCRSAAADGGTARTDAANDYWNSVEELLRTVDIDIRHLVPSRDQMLALLATSSDTVRSTAAHGTRFLHRFAQLDLPGTGVHILVSCGSGFALDESGRSPATHRLRKFLAERDVCLLWGVKPDRWCRRIDGLTELVTEIERLRARCLNGAAPYFGSGVNGAYPVNAPPLLAALNDAMRIYEGRALMSRLARGKALARAEKSNAGSGTNAVTTHGEDRSDV